MSENLDLVRSLYADWERGDFRRVDWADPEIEYAHADGPSPGSWKGVAAMGSVFRDWLSAWEDWTAEAEEYRELDSERVLVLTTTSSGRGKSSGLGVGQMFAHGANLFHVRNGKVTRLVTYWTRDRALADLGLEGQGVSQESATPDLERIARELIEAVNRGDIAAAMTGFRPDAVWDSTAIGLGTHEGLAAIRVHVEDWMRSYDDLEMVMEEFCDLGNGVTFSVHLLTGRPVGSTGYVRLRDAVVSVVAEAKIERFTTYLDIDEARAAAERLAQERR